MRKFCQFLTDLSVRDTSIFSFPDDNLSKYQWIFTKLAIYMCIDIVEICFGIANGQISSFFDRITCPRYDSSWVLSFHIFIYLSIFFSVFFFFFIIISKHFTPKLFKYLS